MHKHPGARHRNERNFDAHRFYHATKYVTALGLWIWLVVVAVIAALIGLALDVGQTTGFIVWEAPIWVWRAMWISSFILVPPIASFKAFHMVRIERDKVRFQLDRRTQKDQALVALSQLRGTGAEKLNTGIQSLVPEDIWWGDVQKWEASIRGEMEKIHSADTENWETLGTFNVQNFGNGLPESMNHKLTMLSLRLDKLHQYIDDRTKTPTLDK
tara:strand:- start:145 stop:786 length:642 start_codon:yes stop_codon:yes gene_type:complete